MSMPKLCHGNYVHGERTFCKSWASSCYSNSCCRNTRKKLMAYSADADARMGALGGLFISVAHV